MSESEMMEHVLGVALVQQFSLKAGLKKFGPRGEKAVTKELTQLHDMVTYIPMDPREMTKEQRMDALASLIFLTEKRNGTIKARACADGSKQRKQPNYRKEDAASPTVFNESVFITSAVEAHEGRDVATIDIPGPFYTHLTTKRPSCY
jgi:hypothetical protein